MSTPRHGAHAALLAALLASALATASAQSPNDDYAPGDQVHVSTAMIALLAAVIGLFLFIAFSTVYLRHCTGYGAARSDADGRVAVRLDHTFASRRQQRRPRGLAAEVVETFPTMKYAEAKALRVGKGGAALECAVCLSEFEDEERLRLLPKCSHAFHPECIGEWLASHVTCPVCRCNLDPDKETSSDDEPAAFPAPQLPNSVSSEIASVRQEDGAPPVAVVIDVVTEEEEEEERRVEAMELQQIGTQRRRAMRSRSGRRPVTTQLARSHSTGHSLAARLDRDLERFTLRLPEHVRREMLAAGEHSLQSLRGRRVIGEGSSGPLGRAGRWQSLLVRTFSGKVSFFSASRTTVSSDGGEVSSTSSSRLRGKRVAAVDVANVPAKGNFRLDRIGGSPSGAKAGTVPHEAAAKDEEKAVTQQVLT